MVRQSMLCIPMPPANGQHGQATDKPPVNTVSAYRSSDRRDSTPTRRAALAAGLAWCSQPWAADAQAGAESRQHLGRIWTVPQGTKLVLRPDVLGLMLPDLVDAIGDWLIPMGSLVTIQLAGGQHQVNKAIAYRGRDGARVRILGSPADPAGCTLLWAQPGDLFFAGAGVVLGMVDGFTIAHAAERRRGNGCAFVAEASGHITCGPNIRVQNFYYGFQARLGGSIKCQGTQCTGAGDAAYFAFNGGHLDAANAVAEGARDDPRRLGSGFVAEYGGTINAEGATARRNALAGFHALSNGVIRAYGATAERNGRAGFLARTGGTIVAHGATARNNCGPGVQVEGPHATFEAGRRSVADNDRESGVCNTP